MHILCDHPTERHPAKRASCQRRAVSEKNEIELVVKRNELQSLLNTPDDTIEHGTKIAATQKKIVTLENALKRERLPADFSEKCGAFVSGHYKNSDGKGALTFEVAPLQADPCVAKMAINRDVDFVVSGDSDYIVYVGPAGDDGTMDVMIKDLKLKMKNELCKSGKIYTGQKVVAEKVEALLYPKLGHSPFDATKGGRVPKYPKQHTYQAEGYCFQVV